MPAAIHYLPFRLSHRRSWRAQARDRSTTSSRTRSKYMSVTPTSSSQSPTTPIAPAIQQLINANQPANTITSSSGTNSSAVSQTQFLQLLTAQLQNQDPTKPMDD